MLPFGFGTPQPTADNFSGYPSQQPNTSYPQNPNCPYPNQTTNPVPYTNQTTNSAPYPNYGQAAPGVIPQPFPGSTNPQFQQYPPSQMPCQNQSQYQAQPVQSAYLHMTSVGNNQQNGMRKEGTPTVHAATNFDSKKDLHDLRKAMKGLGTDEKTLIRIICGRTNNQRQEILRDYTKYLNRNLIADIKSETSGNFEKVLVGLLCPTVDFYCQELKNAMKGFGTNETVLIEILCTLSNMEMHSIKDQYLKTYGNHLEAELKSETSGNFRKLLLSLCSAARDESGQVNPDAAKNDAKELLKAGEQRVGTDESVFIMILCQRNYQQLRLIFQEYINLKGHPLEKGIEKEFSGDIKHGLLAIYKCVMNKPEYFAYRLHKSMAGAGTKDNHLIRVIVTRCEIDMEEIKHAFQGLYGKSLKSRIKNETSGHYRNTLCALIGEPN